MHKPVLLAPALELLAIRPDGIYIDCTLGGGGHAAEILARLNKMGRLIALDQDEDALANGRDALRKVASQAAWQAVQGNFADLGGLLDQMGITAVSGILADLGVSSWQLDKAERGFAYSKDGPLDMRMNQMAGRTAADVVNTYEEQELTRVLRDYGEEKFAARISRAIVAYRQHTPFSTTGELANVVREAMPAAARREDQHPAKRTFQALRIEVNRELAALEKLLDIAPEHMEEGGRLCIITFHSLEDRLVKNRFRKWENPCTCPRSFPVCVCGKKPYGRIVTGKPVVAGPRERNTNPRSRSAKLRCFAFHTSPAGGASYD